MRFCERCGSYMQRTSNGLRCPKCGKEINTGVVEVRRATSPHPDPVYVVENIDDEVAKVSQRCPRCGNAEAYRIGYSIQGEHAGVKQDRSVERFRCTKCLHTWTIS